MTSLSRRQFSTVTLLSGLGAFVFPHSLAAQTEDNPIAQPIYVAQPTVSITVNNMAMTFLVDLASSYSSINPGVASLLGLVPTGEKTIPGTGPTLQAQLYRATLASDAGTFPFQLAVVENLSLVSEHAGAPEIEGILGADFLGQFSDFSLTDTSFTGVVGSTSGTGLNGTALNADLPPPFTVTYPVFQIGGSFFVFVDIIDGKGARVRKLFLLDTGAQLSVVTPSQASKMGLAPLFMPGPFPWQLIPVIVPVQGVGGGAVGLATSVGIPVLGTFNFVIIDTPFPDFIAGILGTDVLGQKFKLDINGGRGTLTITTPLGQAVEYYLGLYRRILRALEINTRLNK